eukprot:TRINITY_DN7016_c0_g1_i1.p1 TRINITY_DN7016_c0_g1~~TRINITY_DN7016_c0_g1_i1.p1  ORF type:complete len:1165 (+),score=104.61 TRINITY_DN7016_c0_g1_i1:47-3541(+)
MRTISRSLSEDALLNEDSPATSPPITPTHRRWSTGNSRVLPQFPLTELLPSVNRLPVRHHPRGATAQIVRILRRGVSLFVPIAPSDDDGMACSKALFALVGLAVSALHVSWLLLSTSSAFVIHRTIILWSCMPALAATIAAYVFARANPQRISDTTALCVLANLVSTCSLLWTFRDGAFWPVFLLLIATFTGVYPLIFLICTILFLGLLCTMRLKFGRVSPDQEITGLHGAYTGLQLLLPALLTLLVGALFKFFSLEDKRRIQEWLTDAEALADQAERLQQSKISFLCNVSHELHTPLNGTMGMAQLLSATNLTVEQQSYVDSMLLSCRHLTRLVDDLLSYTKLHTHVMRLSIHPFHLVDLVDSVVQQLLSSARERGVVLHSYVARDLPAVLLGDSLRVGTIMRNLLDNALKFTSEGGVLLTVSPLPQEQQKGTEWCGIAVEVQDTGTGIAAARRSRIFQPFEGAAPERGSVGSGLGLAICRSLCHMMDGNLEVKETRVGVGTTMRCTLHFRLPSESEQPANLLLVHSNPNLQLPRLSVISEANSSGPPGSSSTSKNVYSHRPSNSTVELTLPSEQSSWLAEGPSDCQITATHVVMDTRLNPVSAQYFSLVLEEYPVSVFSMTLLGPEAAAETPPPFHTSDDDYGAVYCAFSLGTLREIVEECTGRTITSNTTSHVVFIVELADLVHSTRFNKLSSRHSEILVAEVEIALESAKQKIVDLGQAMGTHLTLLCVEPPNEQMVTRSLPPHLRGAILPSPCPASALIQRLMLRRTSHRGSTLPNGPLKFAWRHSRFMGSSGTPQPTSPVPPRENTGFLALPSFHRSPLTPRSGDYTPAVEIPGESSPDSLHSPSSPEAAVVTIFDGSAVTAAFAVTGERDRSSKTSGSSDKPQGPPASPLPITASLRRLHQRILVAEDNALNRRVLVGLLANIGYTNVDTAENGQIALDMLLRNEYHVVLCDIDMPVMDGLQCTMAFRRTPQSESKSLIAVPFVAITANVFQEMEQKALQAGMNAFLTKPVNKEHLRRVLEGFVGSPLSTASTAVQTPSHRKQGDISGFLREALAKLAKEARDTTDEAVEGVPCASFNTVSSLAMMASNRSSRASTLTSVDGRQDDESPKKLERSPLLTPSLPPGGLPPLLAPLPSSPPRGRHRTTSRPPLHVDLTR